jgi:hypothetical protein
MAISPVSRKILHFPQATWSNRLKKLHDHELEKIVKDVLSSGPHNDKILHFVNIVIAELHLRPYFKKQNREYYRLAKKIDSVAQKCLVGTYYSIELAGIQNPSSGKQEIIRPYASDKKIRHLFKEWMFRDATERSFDAFLKEKLSNQQNSSFFENSIRYLHPREYHRFEVKFVDGSPYINNKKLKDHHYIFALSGDGELLLAGKKKKGKFQHSSFFGGGPVLAAGTLEVQNGKIAQVILSSGHYRPQREHGEHLRKFLLAPQHLGTQAVALKIFTHE